VVNPVVVNYIAATNNY